MNESVHLGELISSERSLDSTLTEFKELLGEVERILEISESLPNLLKSLYKCTTSNSNRAFGPFREINIAGLDYESIWELIQTRNRPFNRFIKRFIKEFSLAKFNSSESPVSPGEEAIITSDDNEKYFLPEDNHSLTTAEADDELSFDENDSESGGLEDEESEVLPDLENKELTFDEEEELMEKWLDKAESMEEEHYQKREGLTGNGNKGILEDTNSSDDDISFVEKELYNSDNYESDNDIKYEDFFGNGGKKKSKGNVTPKDEEYSIDEEIQEEVEEDEVEEEEEEEEEEVDEEEFDEDNGNPFTDNINDKNQLSNKRQALSSFDKHKVKLSSDISALEAALIGPKSWELRGEVRATDRPANSLLEVTADVERASKPAPIITQEYSYGIEDLIKKRIMDKQFDDVKPANEISAAAAPPKEGADNFELSQQKSEKGLGELYAESFMQRALGHKSQSDSGSSTTGPTAEEIEAKELFEKVCRQLDTLSHFNYCPRPVVRDASLSAVAVSNLPALSLEDVTPAAESLANGRIAEEAHQKKKGRSAVLLADEEIDRDKRKQLRRASKASKKSKKRNHSYDDDDNDNDSRRPPTDTKHKKLSKKRKISDDAEPEAGSGNWSKSANFFSKLQDDARKDIENSNSKVSSKSMKLAEQANSRQIKL